MKNKIFKFIVFSLSILILSGCFFEKTGIKFKKDYEKLNNVTSTTGDVYRTVKISNDNPFVFITAEEIVKKIENNETFYVYFGDASCSWCRSVIESAIEAASLSNVKTIYYVPIWDENGNEILRDKYVLENGELIKEINGTDAYYKLLNEFDSLLTEYTINDGVEDIYVNEKRIYEPNFIYVKNGKALRITTGKLDKQTDSNSELTEEIRDDQVNVFLDFLLGNACSGDHNC